MASYKVPQDVEAEDKLLGPFSFRQFIYLIIAVLGIVIGWGLSRLFIPLAIIPLPIILLFGALALPLRKDQPMEIYLAAVLSFYLKPRRRLWVPDGIQSLVEIVAPKVIEIERSKNLSQAEAEQRLSYLADIVDTQGWSVRGVNTPQSGNAMTTDAYYEAQQAQDILDSSVGVGRSFETMIDQADSRRHEEMLQKMRPAPQQTAPVAAPADPYTTLAPAPGSTSDPHLSFNPYPSSIHQTVIQPLGQQTGVSAPASGGGANSGINSQNSSGGVNPSSNITTSEKTVSPDIINLANNSDLSIETIAHEAHRIREKQASEDEVVISLH